MFCLLALPDLLSGFQLPLPFGFGGIRPSNLVNNYPNLVSSCSKQNGYPNCLFWRENLPPLEEFHLDLHGSGNFYIRLIDLHGVCINFIELAPDVLKSYLLFFIQKINDICLDNKCYNCVYSVFIPVFIEIPVFIRIYCSFYFDSTGMYLFNLYFYCIYWKCIYSVFFFLIYLIIFVGLDLIFFYSIHVL